MSAFEKGAGGPGPGNVDLDDILQQMFGMGMGDGVPGMPGKGGSRPKRPRKGADEEQEYEATLEELYKGKSTRFASTKNVVCSHCSGTGGKEKAKPKSCDTCGGKGSVTKLMQVGPGLVSPTTQACATCNGVGQFYKDKDRCKKCRGARVVQQKKMLELYIPPGSREGERIVLTGEADQNPDQEPGDIVFVLKEIPHETFDRVGPDLRADLVISLAEALTGFNRVVLKHLDGRGVQLNHQPLNGKMLRPEQVLKVTGEGMPIKKSDAKGDLYLVVTIQFPEDGWLKDESTVEKLRALLPKPPIPIQVNERDEVEFQPNASMEGFGAGSDDPRGAEWEDEDAEESQAQCAQQ